MSGEVACYTLCMRIPYVFIVLLGFLPFSFAVAGMSSVNYQIDWDNFNAGGLDASSSTNYSMLDTIGDNASGTSTSASYQLSAGYRGIEDQSSLSFIVITQANGTQVTYSAFSSGGETVTVSSAAGFSVGDYLVAVENKGFSQDIAMGKITDISGNVITVDYWSGDHPQMSAVPAGGNDYVYKLSGVSAEMGTVTQGTENTTVTMASVLSTGSTGYTVYAHVNHALQTVGAQTIANVADSLVSVGSEEYGVATTGTSALMTGSDFPLTTSQQAIQNRASATPNVADRMGVIYKLSVSAATQAGTYTQDVTYTLTVNY